MNGENENGTRSASNIDDSRVGRGVIGLASVVAAAIVGGIVLDTYKSSGSTEANLSAAVLSLQANLNAKEAAIVSLKTEVTLLEERFDGLRREVKELDKTVDEYRGSLAQGGRFTAEDWEREDRRLETVLRSVQRQIDNHHKIYRTNRSAEENR